MGHTEGPWEIKHEFTIISDSGRGIATCGGYTQNFDDEKVHLENVANAHLIAAAPELLEACKWVESIYAEYMRLNPNPNNDGFRIVTEGVSQIRKAIAKAKG